MDNERDSKSHRDPIQTTPPLSPLSTDHRFSPVFPMFKRIFDD